VSIKVDACTSPIKQKENDSQLSHISNFGLGECLNGSQSFASQIPIDSREMTENCTVHKTDRQSWFDDIMKGMADRNLVSLSSSKKSARPSAVNVIVVVLPPKKHIGPKIRAKKPMNLSHDISFEKKHSRIRLRLQNVSNHPVSWKVVSIGKAYMTYDLKHPIEDQIFKFDVESSIVGPFDDVCIVASFKPLLAGIYSQTFHLRVNGYAIPLNLKGNNTKLLKRPSRPQSQISHSKGMQNLAELCDTSQNSIANESFVDVDRQELLQRIVVRHREKSEEDRSLGRSSQNSTSTVKGKHVVAPHGQVNERPQWLTVMDRPPTPGEPAPLLSSHNSKDSKRRSPDLPRKEEQIEDILNGSISIIHPDEPHSLDALNFKAVAIGDSSILYFKLCNASSHPVNIKFEIASPFALPTRRLKVDARSYMPLPVRFQPKSRGKFSETLTIYQKMSNGNIFKVELKLTGVSR
jgi:hypothetical protein